MLILTNEELENVCGAGVVAEAKKIGGEIVDGIETAAGAVVGFVKGLF